MSVTVSEKYDIEMDLTEYSGSTITYMAWGSENEDDITTAVLGVAPTTFHSIPLKGLKLAHQGAGVWECRAEYSFESDNPSYTFDTTGGTAQITQSKETIAAYFAPGYGLPNFGGAIGVTKDSIEGTQIVIPTYRWTENYYFPASGYVDDAFKATLFALTGTINNATFRNKAAGEVLFEGVRGQKRGVGRWELNYNFAASPNLSGLTVGSLTGIDKDGWQYLWVRYHDFEDSTANALVKRPVFVMIERTYDPTDFSLLGIGT